MHLAEPAVLSAQNRITRNQELYRNQDHDNDFQPEGAPGVDDVGEHLGSFSDDRELGQKNLKLYRDRFGITFPLLFCGSMDDANLNNRLKSQLDNFFAYPTTLFISKEGKVQAIHSGFKGPGTGEEFQSQVQEFHSLAKQLVR